MVCSKARELAIPPKVIMVTGSVSRKDQDRCLELGAIAYLTKPFRPLQLLELVKRAQAAARRSEGIRRGA